MENVKSFVLLLLFVPQFRQLSENRNALTISPDVQKKTKVLLQLITDAVCCPLPEKYLSATAEQ